MTARENPNHQLPFAKTTNIDSCMAHNKRNPNKPRSKPDVTAVAGGPERQTRIDMTSSAAYRLLLPFFRPGQTPSKPRSFVGAPFQASIAVSQCPFCLFFVKDKHDYVPECMNNQRKVEIFCPCRHTDKNSRHNPNTQNAESSSPSIPLSMIPTIRFLPNIGTHPYS